MTAPTAMDKDRLAAFVDGELSPEDSAEVVMHLADHPQDQAYVDDLMASNAALAQAFAAPLHEPVPEALRDLILGTGTATHEAKVIAFPAKPARRTGLVWGSFGAGAALAAGLAVFAFLPVTDAQDLTPGSLAADAAISQLLQTLPSGAAQTLPDGGEVTILASVPTPTGFCREVEVIHPDASRLQAALACTEGSGWTVEVVISEDLEGAAAQDGFGTASGDEAQSFVPFLDRIGAGPLLTPEEEAAAIARTWAK